MENWPDSCCSATWKCCSFLNPLQTTPPTDAWRWWHFGSLLCNTHNTPLTDIISYRWHPLVSPLCNNFCTYDNPLYKQSVASLTSACFCRHLATTYCQYHITPPTDIITCNWHPLTCPLSNALWTDDKPLHQQTLAHVGGAPSCLSAWRCLMDRRQTTPLTNIATSSRSREQRLLDRRQTTSPTNIVTGMSTHLGSYVLTKPLQPNIAALCSFLPTHLSHIIIPKILVKCPCPFHLESEQTAQ